MSSNFTNTYQQTWSCSGAPQTSATLTQGGVIYVGDTVTDTTTGNSYVVQSFTFDSVNQIYNNLVYYTLATNYNFNSLLPTNIQNSEINTTRSPASISLTFSTSRQPSTTNDIFVSANILLSAVLSLSCEVDIQVSPDNSTWTKYGQTQFQISLAGTFIQQLHALVPAGYYYRLVETGSGASINSIFETLM